VAGEEARVTWAFCFPFALAVGGPGGSGALFCLVLPLFTLARSAVAALLQVWHRDWYIHVGAIGASGVDPYVHIILYTMSLRSSFAPASLDEEAQSRCPYRPPAGCSGGVPEEGLVRSLPIFTVGSGSSRRSRDET
jgi:hypothetical protein